MLVVNFLDCLCVVTFAQYGNGRTAIELDEEATGEPMATATVNVPDYPLAPNEVVIKNYSENEGMLDVLIKAGIVSEPKGNAIRGLSTPICDLLIEIK